MRCLVLSFLVYLSPLYNLYLLRLGYNTNLWGWPMRRGHFVLPCPVLPSGMLGGRWGSRFTMVVGIWCVCGGFLDCFHKAELISSGSPRDYFILISYSLGVVGIALFIVNGTPYLMGITGPVERDPVFAMQAALMPFSGFVGSMLGGVVPDYLADVLGVSLAEPVIYRYTLFIGVLCLIPAVFALLATQDVRVDHKREAGDNSGVSNALRFHWPLLLLPH